MSSPKSNIQHFGIFSCAEGEDVDSAYRKAAVEVAWINYKLTKNMEYLAQICQNTDFLDDPEISKTLAMVLRAHNRRNKNVEDDLFQNEGIRLYRILSMDAAWASTKKMARRLRVAEILNIKPALRDKWAEALRKRLPEFFKK